METERQKCRSIGQGRQGEAKEKGENNEEEEADRRRDGADSPEESAEPLPSPTHGAITLNEVQLRLRMNGNRRPWHIRGTGGGRRVSITRNSLGRKAQDSVLNGCVHRPYRRFKSYMLFTSVLRLI